MTKTLDTKDAIDRVAKFQTTAKRLLSLATISCPLKIVDDKHYRIVKGKKLADDLNLARLDLMQAARELRDPNFDYPLESREDLDYMLSLADEFCKVPFVPYTE